MRRRYRLAIGVSLGMAALVLATRDDAQNAEINVSPAPRPVIHDSARSSPQAAQVVVAGIAATHEPGPRGP